MDADSDMQPVPFKVMKAALEAAELRAGMEGVDHRMEIVVGMRLSPDQGARVQPEGGVATLSTLEGKPHLQLLMETTQHFAGTENYPLEMMVIARVPQQG